MYIDVDGGKIYTEKVEHENNAQSTPLFLLPGGPGYGLNIYKINQPSIAENFDVIYHDPRGCGLSTGFSPSSYTIWNNIEDIEKIRAYYGYSQINLLGTSYGSMVAAGYATKYPQHVKKLILVAGAPSYHFLEKAKENLKKMGTLAQQQVCDKFLWNGNFTSSNDIDEFFSIMRPLYSKKAALSSMPASAPDPRIKCNYIVLNEAFRDQFWHFDFVPELKNIKNETLILSGKRDWINDPIYAEQMRDGIQNSKLICFDSGHSMSVDQREEYFKAIFDFLKS